MIVSSTMYVSGAHIGAVQESSIDFNPDNVPGKIKREFYSINKIFNPMISVY